MPADVRLYPDPATGQPHIWNHEVDEGEVVEVLTNPGPEAGQGLRDYRIRASRQAALSLSPAAKEKGAMKRNRFPVGWNVARVRRVLEHYQGQTEDEALAEDEAAFQSQDQTVMVVPKRLVPEITRLIERRRSARATGSYRPNKALQPTAHTTRRA